VTDQTEPEHPESQERDEANGARSSSTSRTRTRRRSRTSAETEPATRRKADVRADARDGDDARGGEDARGGADARGDDAGGRDAGTRDRAAGGRDADGGGRDTETGDRDDDSASGEDDGKRRRRRGRRGRGGKGRGGKGRGNGREGSEGKDTAADGPDAEADEAQSTVKATGSGRGVGKSGSGRSGKDDARKDDARKDDARKDDARKDDARKDDAGKDRSGKGRAAKGGSDKSDTKGGTDPSSADEGGDGAVEAAIAKGGTRMAAKRNRRGNGNGSGRGGRQQRPGGVPEEVRRAILEGPPRTMLVTAREDRTQIAVLEDRTVVEHYVTRKEDVTYVGNIYMARVQNVLPGMEAAFLDIGKGRNGVLYAGEVLYDELDLEEGEDERIENALKPGQKVLVQVTKDPMGSKGPRLTMHLSLAGRYMVLAPNSDLFGISRKLTDRERDRLRKAVKKVKPSEHGVIVRTAAEGATDEQITADLERLLRKWQRVEEAAEDAKALTTVYEEPPLVVKVIRDNFGPEFERCIVDDEDLYQQVRGYLDEVAPELLSKVELYGQPTTDARSKAVGAPSADGATAADDAPADATGEDTGASDPADGAGGEVAAADAEADRAAVDQARDAADAEGERARGEAAPTDAAADAEAAADTGGGADAKVDAATTGAAGGLSSAQLQAARTRRESLPPLFDAYDVADQLRKAMGKKVWLPSGGYLIIETTEAMKVIDVNTGKFTGSGDTNLEEVVLKTNLEAADEIVRQLRLRDMGGIIIIDFIDMLLKSNQEQVVRRLKRELLRDRTKTRVSEVSKLGLVQMTRKNVSQGLVESFSHACSECEGRGIISELG
jgi:Ribonuclease G/E